MADDKKKSAGDAIAEGWDQFKKGAGRGASGVGHSLLSSAKQGKDKLVSKDTRGRPQGILNLWAEKKQRKMSAWWNRHTQEELQQARDEFNDVNEILRRAKDNPYLKAMKFDLVSNTPLHHYADAEASTQATFAQKPKPPKGKEATEDTEEQKAARAAVIKGYEDALKADDPEAKELDRQLKEAQDRLGQNLDDYSKFTEGAPYNPKQSSKHIHKTAVQVKKLVEEQSPKRLKLKVDKTKAYFNGLKDSVKGDDTSAYHDDVQNMIKAGIIEINEGDGAKPAGQQVTEQLKAKEKAQLASLGKQSENSKKSAIKKAENLQNTYYSSLAKQVQLAEILRLQNREKVMAVAAKEAGDDKAGVTAQTKEDIEKGVKLKGSFLEDVAKEQGNVLKGPLGTEIYYNPENGAFEAELAHLNESQQQATIDFQAQVLFQQHGDSVSFTANSDNPNEAERVNEVQRTIRQQVRAVANIDGHSLKHQTFSGIRKGPDGKIEQVTYAQNPTGKQRPLSEAFDDSPELKQEYTQLMAKDKLTSTTAEQRFSEMKQENADLITAKTPGETKELDGGLKPGGTPA